MKTDGLYRLLNQLELAYYSALATETKDAAIARLRGAADNMIRHEVIPRSLFDYAEAFEAAADPIVLIERTRQLFWPWDNQP
jgi:hypothetical protein